MIDFTQARTHMVQSQLATNGIVHPILLSSFSETPRELFVPVSVQGFCYNDKEIDLGGGRFLLEPMVFAKMVTALTLDPDDYVLDIGGATGYGSAILSRVVKSITSVECEPPLIQAQRDNHSRMGIVNIEYILRDLKYGARGERPFDSIVVEGAMADVPFSIASLLARGGKMVVPVVPAGQSIGQVILVEKTQSGAISTRPLFDAWAPYLPGCDPEVRFSFG